MCHEKNQTWYIECRRFDIHIRVWPGTTAFVYTLRLLGYERTAQPRGEHSPLTCQLLYTRHTPIRDYRCLSYLLGLQSIDLTGSLLHTEIYCHCNPPDNLRIQSAPNFPPQLTIYQHPSINAFTPEYVWISRNDVETKTTMNLHKLIRAIWPQQQVGARCNSLSPPDPVRFNRKKQGKHFLVSFVGERRVSRLLTIVSRRGASMIYCPFLVYKIAI